MENKYILDGITIKCEVRTCVIAAIQKNLKHQSKRIMKKELKLNKISKIPGDKRKSILRMVNLFELRINCYQLKILMYKLSKV